MNEDILAAYDRMTATVMGAYEEARQCLADGDLVKAQAILARIAQSHARSSLSLRSVLIKRGMLTEE